MFYTQDSGSYGEPLYCSLVLLFVHVTSWLGWVLGGCRDEASLLALVPVVGQATPISVQI